MSAPNFACLDQNVLRIKEFFDNFPTAQKIKVGRYSNEDFTSDCVRLVVCVCGEYVVSDGSHGSGSAHTYSAAGTQKRPRTTTVPAADHCVTACTTGGNNTAARSHRPVMMASSSSASSCYCDHQPRTAARSYLASVR